MISSEKHETAALIVYEQKGRWAAALRREAAGTNLRIREVRTADDCREELALRPASFIVLEVRENPLPALRFAVWQRCAYPLACWAAVGSREPAAYEPFLREAGAVHVVATPRRLRQLLEIAARHLGRFEPPQGMAEEIWENLPWAECDVSHT